jgi:mono/diheme cytochrome c family protein
MIELFYQILGTIGYTHPVHPTLTHVVMGLVIGAFVFGFVSWLRRHTTLVLTARHCLILALITLFPTVLLGYMDWQHYYAGGWLFEIKMKLILACILLVLLSVAVISKSTAERGTINIVMLYGLCLLTVIALGYFGGELVYGSRTKEAAPEAPDIQAGAELFTTSCSACHPGGGNIYKAHLTLKDAPQLADLDTFLAYIRSPKASDGSQTIMPPVSTEKLSDQNAKEIYQYIIQVLKK